MSKHLITAEDLESNPLLIQLGYKEGQLVSFSTVDDGGDTKEGHDPIGGGDPIKP